jgi:hypothetical protein
MCTVVNKYKSQYDVYIGRGSIWGNPFVMGNNSDAERQRVIDAYRVHFTKQMASGVITIAMLKQLDGKRLGCFCAPKPCHGDVIAEAVAKAVSE